MAYLSMQGKRTTYLLHPVPMEAPGGQVLDEVLDNIRQVIPAGISEGQRCLDRGVILHGLHLHTLGGGGGSVIIIF